MDGRWENRDWNNELNRVVKPRLASTKYLRFKAEPQPLTACNTSNPRNTSVSVAADCCSPNDNNINNIRFCFKLFSRPIKALKIHFKTDNTE